MKYNIKDIVYYKAFECFNIPAIVECRVEQDNPLMLSFPIKNNDYTRSLGIPKNSRGFIKNVDIKDIVLWRKR